MHIKITLFLAVVFSVFAVGVFAKGPSVDYTIRVDASDLSGVNVEMRIGNAKSSTRIAMAAHPEYDDRYWRYIENVTAQSKGKPLTVSRQEDAVWKIDGPSGDITVRYRLRLPAQDRAWRDAWKPFLTPTGGMVGDLHSLMYVVDEENRPARLTLDLPDGWSAASGLEPTKDPRTFTGSTELMLDSPVMIGTFREWKFTVAAIPHNVVIWAPPDAKEINTQPIIDGVQKLVGEAIKAFGAPPYPRYTFLFQSGGSAALEHHTSVNIGLSLELEDLFEELGHEYVHVWNLMDVRPRERVGIRYKFAEPTGVLWWNEGATIMFADLLIRRAGLVGDRRPRLQRLESVLARYFASPGYTTLPAELVSRGDSLPALLGDNSVSTHLQGEVISAMLDLKIRDLTDGRRKLDDVQRELSSRFNSQVGIDNSDIRTAIEKVCVCDMEQFFKEHIYAAKQIDLGHYLALVGMRADITWAPAVGQDGKPVVDLRVGPLSFEGPFKLRITNPNSAWGKAGVKTGDKLISADGIPTKDWTAFRNWLRKLKVGDTGRLVVEREGITKEIAVTLQPYDVPTVRLVELANASKKQLMLREAWINTR